MGEPTRTRNWLPGLDHFAARTNAVAGLRRRCGVLLRPRWRAAATAPFHSWPAASSPTCRPIHLLLPPCFLHLLPTFSTYHRLPAVPCLPHTQHPACSPHLPLPPTTTQATRTPGLLRIAGFCFHSLLFQQQRNARTRCILAVWRARSRTANLKLRLGTLGVDETWGRRLPPVVRCWAPPTWPTRSGFGVGVKQRARRTY